jgi:hypothetical protein
MLLVYLEASSATFNHFILRAERARKFGLGFCFLGFFPIETHKDQG